jgi:hypothetical protein
LHPCLTPFPILASPWSIRTFTVWSTYNLPIYLFMCQSKAVPLRICNNLVQVTWSNTFCLSMKPAHNYSSTFKVCSDYFSASQPHPKFLYLF